MPTGSHRSHKGRLLVANPALPDPNFHRTVVLMLEHGEDGALGVILNRCSDTPVADLLPPLEALAAPPGLVHVGGPVAPSAAICLAELHDRTPTEGVTPLFDAVASVDLDQDLTLLGAVAGRVRLFAGYAGWAAGQLEGELTAGGWFVVDMAPDDPFTGHADSLWRGVLRRQPTRLAMLAGFPDDIATN